MARCSNVVPSGSSTNKKTYDEGHKTKHVKAAQRAKRTFINGQQHGVPASHPVGCRCRAKPDCPKTGTKREGSAMIPTSVCFCVQKLDRQSLSKEG